MILLISTELRTLKLPKHHFYLVAHHNETTKYATLLYY